MSNTKVTRHRVFIVIWVVIGMITLAGSLTGVFAASSAMSGDGRSIIKASAEFPSLLGHLPDLTLELNSPEEVPPGSPAIGRAVAYSLTTFMEVVHWVVGR